MQRSASSSRAPLLPLRLSSSQRCPGRPRRAQSPELSVNGVRSRTAPSVATVWPQIQRLSAWVLVGGAGEPLPLRRHHVAPQIPNSIDFRK
ncbi:hypothetical protein NDU88_002288 [Pleurodeles waltl]|uniref:Uncharacterized protein n=1 Tax=Pleurodeles waltl TaxID=8319 RepID=A0AAV7KT41_PLEWA|nr:hypothetical protein NDU88_002288 [Pleurodeles waltl]